MKLIFTVVLSTFLLAATAQWSNTNNTFTDDLHMPVSVANNTQQKQIILNSYPDGGYFIIWEDERDATNNKTDIYAQKYDKSGVRLWAENGLAIANSAYKEHFTPISSTIDYRTRSYAATDSSGGFFIAYSSDSTVSGNYIERLTVQHIRSNGSGVYNNGGTIVARGNTLAWALSSQLIADGAKGCFVAYKQRQVNNTSVESLYMFGFREEGGVLKNYGGSIANQNANTYQLVGQCGIYYDLEYPQIIVRDFSIWSDQYGGCNMVMSMYTNARDKAGEVLGFNRLFRAKKNSLSTASFYQDVTLVQNNRSYEKDSVYMMYNVGISYRTVQCSKPGPPPVAYTYTDYSLLSNGYFLIDNNDYDYSLVKGITLPAVPGSKVNVDFITAARRTFVNNQVSSAVVFGYARQAEQYDSVPYQRSSNPNPLFGYVSTPPADIDKFKWFNDTVLAANIIPGEYSIAGGPNATGADAYITGLTGAAYSTTGNRLVNLQHLYLHRVSSDSVALDYKKDADTDPVKKGGAVLGQETGTGANHDAGSISYDVPQVAVGRNGTALFYIGQRYNTFRVSPIKGVATLSWGNMGIPIGTGTYNNGYYLTDFPVVAMDIDNSGGAVIAWKDSRNIGNPNAADNIFMRHLDSLNSSSYSVPTKRILPISLTNTTKYANPVVFYGNSKVFNDIEANRIGFTTDPVTPVAAILDDYNIGSIAVNVYQATGKPRVYNGQPYLNRNFTMLSDNLPATGTIGLKLYFSKEEFNLLKTADPSIKDLSYLQVTHQPNTNSVVPYAYTPVTGEEILTAVADSLYDGYSLEIKTKTLGNFFIQKLQASNLCAAGNTSFTSNITGGSYQWQVNTGNSFTNISNGGNYAGATTVTLQINNIPASFNGNRYRCLVGGQYSNAFFLGITNNWTGAVNNQWENIGNWSCGKVPDATTDVIIKSGTITVNSAAVCRSLSVSPSVNITVTPGFSLKIVH